MAITNKLDTSWFDLKKYQKLSELGLEGWLCNIWARIEYLSLLRAFESTGHEDNNFLKIQFSEIKTNPIIYCKKEATVSQVSNKYSTIYDTADLYNWQRDNKNPSFVTLDLGHTMGYHGLDRKLANITVDTTATDEQIKTDFERWLKDYRSNINYITRQKNFTKQEMLDWVESQLLPFMDLKIAELIEGKKLGQSKIGDLLYPNSEVDRTEKVRKTTIPKAAGLFCNKTINAMAAQLKAEAE